MSYKDKTFCPFGIICRTWQAEGCDRVMTQEEHDEIAGTDVGIAFYSDMPECFKPWFEGSNSEEAGNGGQR